MLTLLESNERIISVVSPITIGNNVNAALQRVELVPSTNLQRQGAISFAHTLHTLHAADATLRKELVPTARDDPAALRDGLCATLARLPPRRRKVMVEYVLLGGVNTRMCDADDLAAFLRPIEAACADPSRASKRTGVLVNLIPFNPWPGSVYETSTPKAVARFADILHGKGITATVRHPRGQDIMAACGQLGNEHIRRRQRIER